MTVNEQMFVMPFSANQKNTNMDTTLSLENILHMLSGLSLSNRQWLASHLVEPDELERAKSLKNDEEWIRELQGLHYEGEPTAEELKRSLRQSHSFRGRELRLTYDNE